MADKMLIDATHPEETRVVVVRGNRVEEFDFESANRKQLRGNIYLAKVTRVEPSLQAAFVEYGGNRHGFLAFSEIHPDYYQIPVADRQALLAQEEQDQREQEEEQDRRGRNRRRHRQRGSHRNRDRDTVRSEPVAGDAPQPEASFGDHQHESGFEGDALTSALPDSSSEQLQQHELSSEPAPEAEAAREAPASEPASSIAEVAAELPDFPAPELT